MTAFTLTAYELHQYIEKDVIVCDNTEYLLGTCFNSFENGECSFCYCPKIKEGKLIFVKCKNVKFYCATNGSKL